MNERRLFCAFKTRKLVLSIKNESNVNWTQYFIKLKFNPLRFLLWDAIYLRRSQRLIWQRRFEKLLVFKNILFVFLFRSQMLATQLSPQMCEGIFRSSIPMCAYRVRAQSHPTQSHTLTVHADILSFSNVAHNIGRVGTGKYIRTAC